MHANSRTADFKLTHYPNCVHAVALGRLTTGCHLAHDSLVSVGIVDRSEPNPPLEHLVWRLRKDDRIAEARVRIYPHGRELRIVIGDVLFWSRRYRDAEDSRELGGMATGTRQQFEHKGWRLDEEAASSDVRAKSL